MKVNIYTVYDKVVDECGPVFQAKNDFVANKMIEFEVSDNPDIPLDRYEVYCLGQLDTEKHSFVPEEGYGRLAVSYEKGNLEVDE